MKNYSLIFGAVNAALSVSLGAFGAHAFKTYLIEINQSETFETAARYQMYAGLSLLILGVWQYQMGNKLLRRASRLITAGSIIFPGSLYLICLTQQKFWGAIAPIGGLSLILGYLLMAYTAIKLK